MAGSYMSKPMIISHFYGSRLISVQQSGADGEIFPPPCKSLDVAKAYSCLTHLEDDILPFVLVS